MKAILASDWHIGLTAPKSIRKLLVEIRERVKEEDIKIFIFTGDFCGGRDGARSVNTICSMVRAELPNIPFLTTLGNHDYWGRGRKFHGSYVHTSEMFHANYAAIVETFKTYGIHFLDLDGPWRDGKFTAIVGHTLWYQSASPPSNDDHWIPRFIDDKPFNDFLAHRSYYELEASLNKLTVKDDKRIFASHFPIVDSGNPVDWHFAGPYSWHKVLREQFAFGTFLNGHTHVLSCTGGHYCCNSDYYNPRYIVVDL